LAVERQGGGASFRGKVVLDAVLTLKPVIVRAER